MFLKYPSERKRQKKKKEHSLFRRIWWSINRIWEPWGHFIPRSHEELPMATAQKEPWKHHSIPPACPVHKQGTFEVTVTVPSLHRAEIHLYATTVRPHWPSRAWIEKGQMSSYLCPETWLIHHSWLQTLWVSPAQSCRDKSLYSIGIVQNINV